MANAVFSRNFGYKHLSNFIAEGLNNLGCMRMVRI